MQKMLVSLPDSLIIRFRAAVPARQRSRVITNLIEREVEEREHQLAECARAVEQDKALNEEMADWDTALLDGIE